MKAVIAVIFLLVATVHATELLTCSGTNVVHHNLNVLGYSGKEYPDVRTACMCAELCKTEETGCAIKKAASTTPINKFTTIFKEFPNLIIPGDFKRVNVSDPLRTVVRGNCISRCNDTPRCNYVVVETGAVRPNIITTYTCRFYEGDLTSDFRLGVLDKPFEGDVVPVVAPPSQQPEQGPPPSNPGQESLPSSEGLVPIELADQEEPITANVVESDQDISTEPAPSSLATVPHMVQGMGEDATNTLRQEGSINPVVIVRNDSTVALKTRKPSATVVPAIRDSDVTTSPSVNNDSPQRTTLILGIAIPLGAFILLSAVAMCLVKRRRRSVKPRHSPPDILVSAVEYPIRQETAPVQLPPMTFRLNSRSTTVKPPFVEPAVRSSKGTQVHRSGKVALNRIGTVASLMNRTATERVYPFTGSHEEGRIPGYETLAMARSTAPVPAGMARWTTGEMCEWLASRGATNDILDILRANNVTGYSFLLLSDSKLLRWGISDAAARGGIMNLVEDSRRAGDGSMEGLAFVSRMQSMAIEGDALPIYTI
ncbi:hypothetical protein BC829DRAFT_445868 [Chytridium lagenaria]|nr:hypothetical protein BC829DRAFT_445868 [Chytridium lagenaria]